MVNPPLSPPPLRDLKSSYMNVLNSSLFYFRMFPHRWLSSDLCLLFLEKKHINLFVPLILPFNPLSAEFLPHLLLLFYLTSSPLLASLTKPGNAPMTQNTLRCLERSHHRNLHIWSFFAFIFIMTPSSSQTHMLETLPYFSSHINPSAEVGQVYIHSISLIRPFIFRWLI